MATARITPTPFMEKLRASIIAERGIAETSANTYMANLVLLNEKKAFNNLGFLKKRKEEIMEYLTQYSDNTEMNYLTAIVSALSTHKDQHLYKTIYKFYRDTLNEKLGKRDEVDTTIKTEREKTNWLSWPEVEAKWNELKTEVEKFSKDKSISKARFELLLDYLVLSLYTLIPPRRNKDYLYMYVINRKDGTTLEPELKNYLIMEDEEMVFNCYKTAKHYGAQVEKVPDDLMDVIRLWLKHHPSMLGNTRKPAQVKLLVNIDGSPATLDNWITYRLNRIFEKKIGSTMLRHIFISHKFGDEYDEMVKTAKAMGHSVEEQQTVYRKKD